MSRRRCVPTADRVTHEVELSSYAHQEPVHDHPAPRARRLPPCENGLALPLSQCFFPLYTTSPSLHLTSAPDPAPASTYASPAGECECTICVRALAQRLEAADRIREREPPPPEPAPAPAAAATDGQASSYRPSVPAPLHDGVEPAPLRPDLYGPGTPPLALAVGGPGDMQSSGLGLARAWAARYDVDQTEEGWRRMLGAW
ncbi:hypothetical protein BD413DRAFT_607747 [Trametes elegans]|nr:hypothetical protein BD413DRAFT_607747 [Trametes elegans]